MITPGASPEHEITPSRHGWQLRAILSDIQFWVPLLALLAGIALLIFIRG